MSGDAARDQAHGHTHDHAHANRRAVGIAAALTGAFMLVEVAGGLISGSLALLADAGHMLTDFAALSLAWIAFRIAARPADATRTFGFDRASVLVAFVNGLALFGVAIWIVIEAWHRIAEPAPVTANIMLAVATAVYGALVARKQGDRWTVALFTVNALGTLALPAIGTNKPRSRSAVSPFTSPHRTSPAQALMASDEASWLLPNSPRLMPDAQECPS